jgi:hypothetical protein
MITWDISKQDLKITVASLQFQSLNEVANRSVQLVYQFTDESVEFVRAVLCASMS